MPTWTLFLALLAVTSSFPDGQMSVCFPFSSNPESRGWESTPSSVFSPPACAVILSESSPVLFTATLDPPGAAADAAEPPTTSEVERRFDGSFKTCFAFLSLFFFFSAWFFFFFFAISDASSSVWTNQIRRRSLRQRR